MRPLPLLVLLAACQADPDGTADGPVTLTATGDVQEAACVETDNALRFVCTATVDPPAAATWTVTDGAGTTRVFETAAGGSSEVTVWGLPPDTAFTWSVDVGAGSASGTLQTGALPSGLSALSLDATGTASVDGLGFPQTCGGSVYLLVVDATGRVVWYEPAGTAGPGGGVAGYDYTAVGTVILASGGVITELGMDGVERWSASGFDRPLHHDLMRGGRYVYALNAAEHDGYVVDGLYVLEDGALVAQWDLADHVTVAGAGDSTDGFWQSEFPGAVDWSHANSVWSDGVDLMLSLRWQDAVLKLDGDPTSPGFGEIDWILTGTDDEDLPGDFDWPEGGGFDGQHHASPMAGGVAVFDNRAGNQTSRALEISLDEGALTASEVASWTVGGHCEIQGAAYPLPDGGMLATCATTGTITEYGPGENAPRFELVASCGSGGGGPGGGPGGGMSRGVPVDLP